MVTATNHTRIAEITVGVAPDARWLLTEPVLYDDGVFLSAPTPLDETLEPLDGGDELYGEDELLELLTDEPIVSDHAQRLDLADPSVGWVPVER